MMNLPDAPWVREVESTGYYCGGWWNNPPAPGDPEYEDEEEEGEEEVDTTKFWAEWRKIHGFADKTQ